MTGKLELVELREIWRREALEQSRKINRKRLIDVLNYVNFQNGTILVNLQHLQYGSILSLHASPQPCAGNTLRCLWTGRAAPANIQTSYRSQNFLINKGPDVLVVEAEAAEMTAEGISFVLPEYCNAISLRKARRYRAESVRVKLMQNGVIFPGVLEDFSTLAFCVRISAEPRQTFQWINPESSVHVIFTGKVDEILYSGECRIIRQSQAKRERTFVLEPVTSEIQRFEPSRFRNSAFTLTPQPGIVFNHPLTNKTASLEVDELSSSWFSAVEYHDNSTLFPGLVIPELHLEIAPQFSINCKAQVMSGDVYEADEKKTVKWQIVVLDMEVQEQVKLASLIQRVADRKSYVCGKVDLDALLGFFFDAGFVYPKKYVAIEPYKERFKETYEKLYIESPAIAKHFIHQERGVILGHVAMIRFYENTWLIHHHAAVGQHAAGLSVLNQIGRYINDYRCLYSSHMDFVACYFRPENRFPKRVFGGFAQALNDVTGCSVDPFAYMNFHFKKDREQPDATGIWELSATQPEDLLELKNFYEYMSGGLMINALDLEPDMIDDGSLNSEYERLGFKRERHLFSLKKAGELKAIIVATVSSTGLNMSNLTNCMHAIVMGPEDLPFDELSNQLAQLSHYYEEDEIPILLYPLSYAQNQSISYEKVYNLWTFNARYTDHFLEYMETILRTR